MTISFDSKGAKAGAHSLVAPEPPRDVPPPRPAARYYETLDALRGVAALAVLLLHTSSFLLWPGLARSAYLAVDFFFVLSGFVVAHAYDGKLRDGLPVGRFLWLRMVRLTPLHWAGLGIAALLVLPGALAGDYRLPPDAVVLALVLGALFIPWPSMQEPPHLFPLNPPAWSLFLEVLASLAFGLAHRWLSTRVLIAMVGGAGAVLCFNAVTAGTIDGGVRWTSLDAGLARLCFSFPLGVLLCRGRAHIPPALGALGPWPLLAILFALCLPTVPAPWTGLYDLAFVAVIAPLLVAAGTRASPSPAARPFFLTLGAISFPLYVLHEPLRGGLLALAERAGFGERAGAVVYLGAIIAIAWAAAPVDAAIRRWIVGRRQGAALRRTS